MRKESRRMSQWLETKLVVIFADKTERLNENKARGGCIVVFVVYSIYIIYCMNLHTVIIIGNMKNFRIK